MNTQTSAHDLDFCTGLLCIELDSESPLFTGKAPPLLTFEATNVLASHVAGDLNRLLEEGVAPAGLVLAGALYDQTDVFRPGFPLLSALADLMRRAPRSAGLPPPQLVIGASDGRFPIAALNPQSQTGFGPLALLPFCLVGTSTVMDRVFVDMENTLARNAQASPTTHAAVQTAFGIPVSNLFYATLGDLCAWLRIQFENNDLYEFWQLLEPALFERPGPHQVTLAGSGNCYLLMDDEAWAPFYTFDDWAHFGPGRAVAVGQLGEEYQRWLRQFRLYAVALPAYGLPLRTVPGTPAVQQDEAEAMMVAVRAAPALDDTYLTETTYLSAGDIPPARLLATQHTAKELDTIAYSLATLAADGQLLRLEHFYPLRAEGLEAIVDQIRQRGESQGVPYALKQPGWLVYSPTERCLGALDENDQVMTAPPRQR
ncbi:MAG: hypothetical protein H6974_10595 [Gammaproteobacteria bacterium]|nr:hypothetical protein [Gammaproteobacteria bacterium]